MNLTKIKSFLPRPTFSNFFIFFLVLVNILPVLAPIFMSWGWTFPARIIYLIYSFMCHQIHWRSLHIADHQCAWCARDMAIWGGVLIIAVLIKTYKIQGLKWYQIIPFVIPIALDGGIQTIASAVGVGGGLPVYISNNLARMVTGATFGLGFGAVMMPLTMSLDYNLQKSVKIFKSRINFNIWKALPIGFVVVFIGYVSLIILWGLTSTAYKPSNFLDSENKQPAMSVTIVERRENGICPVTLDPKHITETDILVLNCFINGEESTNDEKSTSNKN